LCKATTAGSSAAAVAQGRNAASVSVVRRTDFSRLDLASERR
jgi:hypothetical protein